MVSSPMLCELSHSKLIKIGEGFATIAGGQGTMWTTALQIGELVDTAQRVSCLYYVKISALS